MIANSLERNQLNEQRVPNGLIGTLRCFLLINNKKFSIKKPANTIYRFNDERMLELVNLLNYWLPFGVVFYTL
jgi:hypothetical protein